MIAYCGINCDECPSCKGTLTGDETLLAKMNAFLRAKYKRAGRGTA